MEKTNDLQERFAHESFSGGKKGVADLDPFSKSIDLADRNGWPGDWAWKDFWVRITAIRNWFLGETMAQT